MVDLASAQTCLHGRGTSITPLNEIKPFQDYDIDSCFATVPTDLISFTEAKAWLPYTS